MFVTNIAYNESKQRGTAWGISNHDDNRRTRMYDPSDSYCDASNAFGTAADHQCAAESSSLFSGFDSTESTWGTVSTWSDDSFSSSDWSSSSSDW
jgi:hypothetical protein